jgi:tRNA threonylcarbamoyl adenosine modification protein YeaZ
MTANGPILAIDTATTHAVIALGAADGALLDGRAWVAGYRHGEELLARIEALLADHALRPADLGGIAVGTGPGAFTGLRVGIATAKALAHALGLPIVGVATGSALLAAAAAAASGVADVTSDATGDPSATGGPGSLVLLQPAGANDRVFLRPGEPARILAGGTDPDLRDGEELVAVDLAGRAPGAAVARGVAATDGLAAALVVAAAARFAAGDADDLARLVPEYVTLPRGVRAVLPDEGVELSGGKPGSRP